MRFKLLSMFLILFLLSPSLAAAGIEEGKEMIIDALDGYQRHKADQLLADNYGVTLGNLSETENVSPSAKLVNSIAAAEQHPENVKWVVEERRNDYITYVIVGLILLLWTAAYFFLQKITPEQAGRVTEYVSGYEQFLGYGLFVKTLVLLIAIPTLLPFLLDFSIQLEQGISSGIMQDSLEYISLSSENVPLYFYQAISYALSGVFFLARINFINMIYAKVLILGIALAIPWNFLRYLGIAVLLYFETALFMRPVVLWISAEAVKHVAGMSTAEAVLMAPSVYGTMTIVTVVIVFLAITWPLIYVLYLLIRSSQYRTLRRMGRSI